MASTTDIRKWAKEQGFEVGAKGPVSPDVKAQYDAAHDGGDDYPPAEDEQGGQGAEVATATAPPPAERQAERTPGKPKTKPAARGRDILGRLRGRAAPRKPAKRLPRMSLANLIEDAWGQMAWAASPMPPMQRLLQAQAPFAGIALEDALAGTFADRALQPIARAEDKAKAVGGLVMPPVALMLALATAPVPVVTVDDTTGAEAYTWPEPSMQHKGALMTLRWSLMLWSEAGQARLDEYRERAEASAERGRQADEFMAYILTGARSDAAPEPRGQDGADPLREAVNAEEEAVRRAQQLFGDQT